MTMRPIAIAPLLLLAACGPSIWQRQYAACYTDACRAGVMHRQAAYRSMVMSEPFPVAQPVYVPQPVYQAPTYMPTAPSHPSAVEPRMLDIVAPPQPQAQTWGQTNCAPTIAPVMWDTPVTERNYLIPGGC